jgi:hypothetical protein
MNNKWSKQMFRTILTLGAIGLATTGAWATEIGGSVSSKCSVFTANAGVYGNPTADELSTKSADGGIDAKVRYDVTLANAYKAKISWPTQFSTSPTLSDAVNWDGETKYSAGTVTAMSGYEAAKTEYNEHTEFALTQAGSTWFTIESEAKYGSGKAFPGGEYKAMVTAVCIAN